MAQRASRTDWSSSEVETLVAMRCDGKRSWQVAAALGRSIASVNNRIAKMIRSGAFSPLESVRRDYVDAEERFWALVDKSGGDDACWNWTGHLSTKGYGKPGFSVRLCSPDQNSHRTAYLLTFGDLPPKPLVLRHICDNPMCCNPAHLLPGTYRDNAMDCIRRGRHARQAPQGEASPKAKLTEEDVRRIRSLHSAGLGSRKIAKRFPQVSRATVAAAMNCTSWVHVS